MATNDKTTPAPAPAVETPKNKAVSGTVPFDVWDALEGYAYGTRQKLTKVVSQAVVEYYERNKDEIQSKRV